MPTEAEVLAALRGQLVTGLIDPNITDKRHIITELGAVDLVGGISGGGGGGTATTPTDITTGIDVSTKIETLRSLLAEIKAELVNSKALADILVQDSSATPRYFVRQDTIDNTTGIIASSIVNLDGSAPSPAPTLPLIPVKAGSTNLINEDLYVAAVAGTGYTAGDSIANVRLLSGETGLVVVSSWYNITTRVTISVAPPIVDLRGYEDKVEELLVSIDTTNSRHITSKLYRASADGTGYAQGHTIERIEQWDGSTDNPTYLGTTYRNLDLGTTLSVAPADGTIYPMAGGVYGNNGLLVDRSGSIALGGTAQIFSPSNSKRQGYLIQNTSQLDLFINDAGTATTASYKLSPGAEYNPAATGSGPISILGATTGQTWFGREWDVPSVNSSTLFISSEQAAYKPSATIVRSADTNRYIANDVYGSTFELTGFDTQFVTLTQLSLIFRIGALPVGMGAFSAYLYNSAPSVISDNAAFSIPPADLPKLLTPAGIYLGVAKLAVGGGLVVLDAPDINRQIPLTGTSIFGRLITHSEFTPTAAAETIDCTALFLGV